MSRIDVQLYCVIYYLELSELLRNLVEGIISGPYLKVGEFFHGFVDVSRRKGLLGNRLIS
jgi:hypothetical protein